MALRLFARSQAAPAPRMLAASRWVPRDLGAGLGLLLLGAVCVLALLASTFAPMDPEGQDILNRLAAPLSRSAGHIYWLGTDQLGRDILSRVIYGARVSLFVGATAVVLSSVFGTLVGIFSGYYGRLWDDLLMRITDVQLAFPSILLSLAIVAVLGAGVRNLIVVLAVSGWVGYARVARSRVLGIRQRDFVEAVRALGASHRRILWRHIVPNVLPSTLTIASFSLGGMITAEAALTFLGLGIPATLPSWGGMLTDGAQYMSVAWWMATFPGLAIMLTVLATNLVGDWLRDVLDPRLGTS